MSQTPKKHAIVSYENMSSELAAVFAEKYPRGFNDYLPDLLRYDKPDGTFFYAVKIELPEAVYMVKIKVKTDDVEDLERWLDGDDETTEISGTEDPGDESSAELPDDNISQYSTSDDDTSEA